MSHLAVNAADERKCVTADIQNTKHHHAYSIDPALFCPWHQSILILVRNRDDPTPLVGSLCQNSKRDMPQGTTKKQPKQVRDARTSIKHMKKIHNYIAYRKAEDRAKAETEEIYDFLLKHSADELADEVMGWLAKLYYPDEIDLGEAAVPGVLNRMAGECLPRLGKDLTALVAATVTAMRKTLVFRHRPQWPTKSNPVAMPYSPPQQPLATGLYHLRLDIQLPRIKTEFVFYPVQCYSAQDCLPKIKKWFPLVKTVELHFSVSSQTEGLLIARGGKESRQGTTFVKLAEGLVQSLALLEVKKRFFSFSIRSFSVEKSEAQLLASRIEYHQESRCKVVQRAILHVEEEVELPSS